MLSSAVSVGNEVAIVGKVDTANAEDVRARLHERIGAARGGLVVIDCSRMTFIDGRGIGVLVGALRRARRAGGDVVLRSLRPAQRKVFEIVGLTKVFRIR
jgi:anti-sigma B factor antagonist